ncbi:UNKNOWN [Stylonychia lemnae]|uniref:Uncharacterized protein n=1 Tax=Stylonychia lemnae TaxID=5949 RepID=A0A077ZUS8_STYLE|nr:UNKNOWN [Stylonychia lemnae]|eukprot:CDW72211.1 UNKNOWN [Stylonychia lemnae]
MMGGNDSRLMRPSYNESNNQDIIQRFSNTQVINAHNSRSPTRQDYKKRKINEQFGIVQRKLKNSRNYQFNQMTQKKKLHEDSIYSPEIGSKMEKISFLSKQEFEQSFLQNSLVDDSQQKSYYQTDG